MTGFTAYRIHKTDAGIEARFETLGLDDLTEGDVVIRAQYSGINYKDALAATGAGQILRSFPLVGGIDVAGIVETSAAPGIEAGQAVVVTGCGLSETRDGGYSEFVRAPAEAVIPLSDKLSTREAMAFGTAGFTAALAITKMEHNGQNPERGPVVVTGATGGVGSLAVSMLAGLGYRVSGVSGKSDAESFLRELGATEVLDRNGIDFGTRPMEKARWAGAIDNVGGETLAWLTRTTDWWGNIASIGLAGGHELHTTVMPFILRGVNLLGINSVMTPRDQREKVWARLASDLKPARLDLICTRSESFSRLPELFQGYLDGTVTGRTIIEIAPT